MLLVHVKPTKVDHFDDVYRYAFEGKEAWQAKNRDNFCSEWEQNQGWDMGDWSCLRVPLLRLVYRKKQAL